MSLQIPEKRFLPNSRAVISYEMLIRGKVISGKGEGKKYLSEKIYAEQFKENLSFIPFPGTLNLSVKEEDYEKFKILREEKGIIIHGFEHNGKKFGDVKCFVCTVGGRERGAIVIPEKSHYNNVLEVISDRNLRGILSLRDGDEVDILIGEYE